jgi:hypothetical protein
MFRSPLISVCSCSNTANWSVKRGAGSFSTQPVLQTWKTIRLEFHVPRHGRVAKRDAFLRSMSDLNLKVVHVLSSRNKEHRKSQEFTGT